MWNICEQLENKKKCNLNVCIDAFLVSIITKQFCISVSDWLGYSYFDNPNENNGYCVVSHSDKTVIMSDVCDENIPSIECYNNTKT